MFRLRIECDLSRRKRIRLKDYDYSQNGCYFITICTKERMPVFCDKTQPQALSHCGEYVNTAINNISLCYPNVLLDGYVIMPDHVHLILTVQNGNVRADNIRPYKSVSNVVGQMKRWVSKQIGFSVWQKSYYEHIIRNEKEYIEARQYVLNNPLKLLLKNEP